MKSVLARLVRPHGFFNTHQEKQALASSPTSKIFLNALERRYLLNIMQQQKHLQKELTHISFASLNSFLIAKSIEITGHTLKRISSELTGKNHSDMTGDANVVEKPIL